MQGFARQALITGAIVLSTVILTGCPAHMPAPVIDRGTMSDSAVSTSSLPSSNPSALPPPGIENQGKPGYYTVRPGDTVRHIATQTGQNWRDVVRWNDLGNADMIAVGQVLRVASPEPGSSQSQSASTPSGTGGAGVSATAQNASQAAGSSQRASAASTDGEISWMWPAQGSVLANFNPAKNDKGIDIGGSAGDPVYAAASGRVIAITPLTGYGNVILIQHNGGYLSAYTHVQKFQVQEKEVVTRGQKIAEIGSSTDGTTVKLHFEIRRNNEPVDPARYLPAR
ncbi:MAG: peptidoglycan DD-metalloendopeptidase family protein [Burkholderiaceae bacterium]|jgi:lipoprotein NlpD|nr:peptidoglycan DD-metalloendopeptidase family protein [Burkholderiaceae bacterium]